MPQNKVSRRRVPQAERRRSVTAQDHRDRSDSRRSSWDEGVAARRQPALEQGCLFPGQAGAQVELAKDARASGWVAAGVA
jgi:hypothetical protein